MTTFFIILGIFLGLFFIFLCLQGLGFDNENPNDPRSESEKRGR
jgi:hypothetical protein